MAAVLPDRSADSLVGKQALVCGGTQGIGSACAVEIARRGATVTLLARDREALARAAAELPTPDGQRHLTLELDLADTAAVRTAAAALAARATPISILVNNAGGPPPGPALAAQPEAFLAAIETHLIASHLLVQALVPGMKQAGYGRIVNIISTSVREPIANLGVSNTTRGAMASWAKTLSGELAPFQITVNNILPGYTETGRLRSLIEGNAAKRGVPVAEVEREFIARIPLGRFARPEEIARVAAFLASPAASYITGVSLPVDGGRIAGI